MQLRLTFAILLVLIATGAYSQSLMRADEVFIKGLVKQMEDGWNAGSGERFAAPFAPDADYVVVNGSHVQGRKAIQAGHDQIFTTIYKGSRNQGTIKKMRAIGPDVAIAHVEWNLAFGPDLAQKGHAYSTLLIARTKGKWQIESFQNTPVQSFGGN